MGRVDGKVAFITGAGRGQGRSHAIALAREGADIIAVDICAPVGSAPYEMATRADLDETVRLVEEAGGRIVARVADVRDLEALTAVVDEGVKTFGRLDIILANAGITAYGALSEMTREHWQEMIDINLTGVWQTVRAGAQHIIKGGNGGSIVLTSSTAGMFAYDNLGHYVVAKHGIVGLAKTLAKELGPHNIRVNSLHPSNVNTPMLDNPGTRKIFRPDLEDPQLPDVLESFASVHTLNTPWLEPEDISNAVLYLVSDDGRFVTGSQFVVNAGMLIK
ncbi:mycofactocin-coupled SDR family oxidoreductase [Mycobacterium sp. ITM-2016-00317]|uniref:mycofactocin-coupled SDR family oxidoreductase n=1 Tax=Mycobacterium sp. ITM-2016-00317 TaxID=2099694 RepID=UPI00287F77B9|nr:mycofactocin-coupled SDR family oxidoreductase [Mycobacterium sp. ITM-2016-00317]WNG87533.1 mycofactocin-coupled SDR family oxidoreductase [Mycobacterium sp. ITM-2016-00317]